GRVAGGQARHAAANPYLSARLLALLLLSRLPADAWADPEHIERWGIEHHPYWSGGPTRETRRPGEKETKRKDSTDGDRVDASSSPGLPVSLSAFLLDFAYQSKLVQAAKAKKGSWVVRLSPVGRWLLSLAEQPAAPAAFPQTLLVQPNLEIVAYRQGLTPG